MCPINIKNEEMIISIASYIYDIIVSHEHSSIIVLITEPTPLQSYWQHKGLIQETLS